MKRASKIRPNEVVISTRKLKARSLVPLHSFNQRKQTEQKYYRIQKILSTKQTKNDSRNYFNLFIQFATHAKLKKITFTNPVPVIARQLLYHFSDVLLGETNQLQHQQTLLHGLEHLPY